jgi:hypothetical protein
MVTLITKDHTTSNSYFGLKIINTLGEQVNAAYF